MRELSEVGSFLEFLGDAILIANDVSEIVYANSACSALFGYSQSELTSMRLDDLIPASSVENHRHKVKQYIHNKSPAKTMRSRALLPCINVEGNQFHAKISIAYIEISNELHGIATIQDYSDIENEINELKNSANTDSITGLANQRSLQYLLENDYFSKWSPSSIGVVYFDLNKFKIINDNLGHHVGDLLLGELGSRLNSMLRADDYVFRVGGDEFLILFKITNGYDHLYELEAISKKIHNVVSQPVTIENVNKRLSVEASIGIGVYPQDNEDLSLLISLADKAMYLAKSTGAKFSLVKELDNGIKKP